MEIGRVRAVCARELFNFAERPTKRMSDYLSTAPAEGILATIAPNGNSAFPLKGS
jgi:hypothetical protein